MEYDDIARMALAFCLESETWPVFIEWVRTHHNSERADEWAKNPDLNETRQLWLSASSNPILRSIRLNY